MLPDDDTYSDEETERRATQALRHALSTPYKPQREMVGKTKAAEKPARKGSQAKRSTRSTS